MVGPLVGGRSLDCKLGSARDTTMPLSMAQCTLDRLSGSTLFAEFVATFLPRCVSSGQSCTQRFYMRACDSDGSGSTVPGSTFESAYIGVRIDIVAVDMSPQHSGFGI